jgi:hypothetical protein
VITSQPISGGKHVILFVGDVVGQPIPVLEAGRGSLGVPF